MTHCTSFFQMSSGRKAKFSTATTSSGTNGMLFFCQQLNTWDASYNTTAEIEITFIHNCQLETSVHFLKSNLSFLIQHSIKLELAEPQTINLCMSKHSDFCRECFDRRKFLVTGREKIRVQSF